LLKRLAEDQKTAGGIIIPDTATEKSTKAEVVAVGDGCTNDAGHKCPLAVKAGDVVLVGKWGGTEVKLNGTEYLILKESEILGIVQE
jgi:chaperonin GroES